MKQKTDRQRAGGLSASALPYISSILFIMLWWLIAFQPDEEIAIETSSHRSIDMHPFHSIDRDQLKDALAGDVPSMMELMEKWDKEAQQVGGFRLTPEEFMETHLLRSTAHNAKGHFFPQTYAAACFMLALADSSQIVALPKGLRKQTQLFSKAITDQIKYDSNRFNTELLSIEKPTGAFVTTYSDPGTLYALRQQKIPTFTLNEEQSIDGIMDAIRHVGAITGNREKAELLCLFMKAALYALDNRTQWLQQSHQMPRFLCAYQINGLRLPTKRTLTGQILTRMGVETSDEKCWTIPLTQEYLHQLNPDVVVIASESEGKGHIPYSVQMFATQHVILAYYDILHALIS